MKACLLLWFVLLGLFMFPLKIKAQQPTLVGAEYFFNTDPGVGNGTNLPITPGPSVSFQTQISTTGLDLGFHRLSVRFLDNTGSWGLIFTRSLWIGRVTASTAAPIVAAEYFFGEDPGFGNGTTVAVAQGLTVDFSTVVSTSGLSDGFHHLSFRVMDQHNVWSLAQRKTFWIGSIVPNEILPIVAAEYFFNEDPGFGRGTSLSVTQGPSPRVEGLINVGDLPRGFHSLSIRFRDQANGWSLVSTRVFYVDETASTDPAWVDYVEYFFDDNDPGLGNASEIPLGAAASAINLDALIAVAALEEGEHTISVRIKNNRGLWSIVETREFTVGEAAPGDPPQPDLETLPDLNAECEFNIGSLPAPTATAADGSTVTGTTDESIFPISQQGTTVITWTYTDENGLETTQTQNIVIQDTHAPSISAPADISVNIALGSPGASNISLGNPVVSDNCGDPAVSNNAPEVFPPGLTVVLWTVEDASGNRATAEQRITVGVETRAQQSPLVAAEYFFNKDPGFGNGTALPVTAGLNPRVESVIPVGDLSRGFHRLSVRFRNDANEWGLVSTNLFFVENQGFGNPVLVDYVEYFFDDRDPGLGRANQLPLESAAAIDMDALIAVAELEEGEHTVSVRIRNSSGLWSMAETHAFTVDAPEQQDPPLPDLETLPDLTAPCLFESESLTPPTATTADGSVLLGVTDESIFPLTQQGIIPIVWTYTDANGLESTQEQRIILEDLAPPVIEGVEDMVVETDPGNCSLTIAIVPPTALDDCSVESLIGTRSDELPLDAPFPVGITVIKWVASDVFGNVSLPIEQEIQVVENVHGPTSPGSLDLSFLACPNEGANGTVLATVVQPDGKVLIGGDFTSVNGISRNRIARLNEDGSLDSSFDPGAGASHFVEAIALQADGKVLIVGRFSTFNGTSQNLIARLNEDGSLDTSFNPGLRASGRISGISIQRDGKILIGGDFSSFDWGSNSKLVRLHVDGGLDTTFDVGTGPNGWVFSVGLQEDGSILVGGIFTSFDGVPRNNLARLNSDGRLDTTFDPGPVPGSNNDNEILSIAIQPDGKILIAGFFTSYQGLARRNLARLNSDGSMDVSFDPGNVVGNRPSDITVQADGRILISGIFSSDSGIPKQGIVRLYANGRLDPTFEPGWLVNGAIQSISLQADGKILLGGTFTEIDGVSRNRIARIFGGGTIEPSHAPVPNLEVLPDLTEECAFNIGSLVIPTATAADGRTILGTTDESIFPLTQQGIIPIVWTYTDANGLESTQEQQLVIQDLIPPTVSVPADIMLEADPGECFASGVDLGVPDTADNCGVESLTNDAPEVFPLGTTVVTWTATDPSGNESTQHFNVVVEDREAPSMAAPADITINMASGSQGASNISLGNPVVSDNCGDPIVSNNAPEVFPPGLTVVLWIAEDAAGNRATAEQRIMVTVEQAPVLPTIQAPAAILAMTDPGSCAATGLDLGMPQVSGDLAADAVSNDAPSVFTIGTTVVTWTLRDRAGNTVMAQQEVVVQDTERPIFLPTEDIRVETPMGVCTTGIQVTPPQATDNCTIHQISGTRSDGLALTDPYPVGLTSVTWVAIDGSGNESDPLVQEIEVVEDLDINASPGMLDLSFRVEAFSPTGSETASFQGGVTIPRSDLQINTIVIQPDGKILIGGQFSVSNGNRTWRNIVRLNSDGTFDEGFNIGSGTGGRILAIALQDDGKILIGGRFFGFSGLETRHIARLNPDGSIDRGFNTGRSNSDVLSFTWNWSNNFGVTNSPNGVLSIRTLPDGRILIGGSFFAINSLQRPGIAVLNSDGTLVGSSPLSGGVVGYNSFLQASNNRILASSQCCLQWVDYEANSNNDVPGVRNLFSFNDRSSRISNISMQDDKTVIVVGGRLSSIGFVQRFDLEINGIDPTFHEVEVRGGHVFSSHIQKDGKIIIGGNFTSVDGRQRNGIARLHKNGMLDESFVPPSSLNTRALAIHSDGRILVGGSSFASGELSLSGIVRLYSDPCIQKECIVDLNPEDRVLRLNANGRATLRVEDVISAAASHCQNDELQFHLSQTVFTCGDLGDNLVTLRVVSEDGSESDAAFNVRIIDDTPPVIDKMRPLAVLKRPDKSYKLPDFTSIYKATDNCGVMTYIQQPEPGTLIEEPGDYQLIFAATDGSGNKTSVEVTLFLREREEDWLKQFEAVQNRSMIVVPWDTPFSLISETSLIVPTADADYEEIQVDWNPDGYNPLVPGLYTLSGKVNAKSSYQGEEELELHVLVGKKPLPEDILISNDKLTHRMKAGGVIGSLSTLDPIDDIHSYALDEHPEVFLEKGELVWKGAERPPALTKVNVHSTDRAGQTISRELTLYRDRDLPIDVTVYPNPAMLETNLFVQFPEPAEVSIRVFDAAGRLIYQERDRRERSFTRVLDLRGYSQGMYQILVQVDNQLLTRKFVKQ